MDPHPLQFLDGVLRWFGFMFTAAMKIRHQCDMDEQAVSPSLLQADLPDRLQKRLAFDISGSAADFRYDHISVGLFPDGIDKALDLVGDVRDHLNRFTQVFPAAFFVQDIPVYLPGGQVGILIQILVDKALIMTKIKIGLRSIFRYINFPMLIGTHRPGIYIDVRIQLLRSDLQPSGFQEPSQRCGSDAFSKTGYDTACNEDEFCHFL